MTRIRRLIPWSLVLLRPVLAVAMLTALLAGRLPDGAVLAACIAAFGADYFDGVLARRWGVATPALRKADSFSDTLFYLSLACITWKLHAEELREHSFALALCLGSLAAWTLLDLFRWRRFAGFHSWSAKLFGLGLFVWTVLLYGGGGASVAALTTACVLGLVAHLEGIAISLLLRHDVTDVPTFWHAWRMRREAAGASVRANPE
jgi:CDP-diacylglycerol--glycerol-3-phosphate 3-phosphatidyltransferase